MSMSAVMQMHMGGYGPTSTTAPMDAVDTGASLPTTLDPRTQLNGTGTGTGTGTGNGIGLLDAWTNVPTSDSLEGTSSLSSTKATSNVASVSSGPITSNSLASPPNSGISLRERPTRSRAASGSGYVSASGSRSRAASGSGYQSLLDSRSRAVSSGSSVFMYERDDEDELEDHEEGEEGGDHESEGLGRSKSSQMGAASAGVDPVLRAKMDPIFYDFMAEVCSDCESTTSLLLMSRWVRNQVG